MEQRAETLSGTIERFLFKNAENQYSVFILTTPSQSLTATGVMSGVSEGQEVELVGTWVVHPRFGRQFQVQRCISKVPTSITGLKKYLGSGLIRGIGPVMAARLVDRFGEQTLEVIEKQPQLLADVSGIGPKLLTNIIASWEEQRSVASIMVFLQDKGVSPAYAARIYKRYGNESIAVVTENPYRLAEEVWGIGFVIADSIAQHLGYASDGEARLGAGIVYTLTAASNQGHVYVERTQLLEQATAALKLEEASDAKLTFALDTLLLKGKLTAVLKDGQSFIAITSHHNIEHKLAQKLMQLKAFPSPLITQRKFDYDAIYKKLRLPGYRGIELNEAQQRGILAALQTKVTIITGGPGTGKTTLLRSLLQVLDDHNVIYKLAAPTGRAAKRMNESTGRYAMTIHRLLEFDPRTMKFAHTEDNALKLDFLIVDETSMIDLFLANALVQALPLAAHIVFIGDCDQLPSVGPGSVLKDLISSGQIATTCLKEIFRQAQESMIVMNAHRVNQGEFPQFHGGPLRDFLGIKETDPQALINHLKKVLFVDLQRRHINPLDAHILVPMNRGVAGTQAINMQLQALLNPAAKPSLSFGGTTFKEGDKVMQIRNNYDKHIFNGDVGVIGEIKTEERSLSVQFGDRDAVYESNELDELTLAYATTIHKSQGSEYAAVIIPLFTQHYILLQRNLLYTAITRAKKCCILIGDPRAIALALKKTGGVERVTFLCDFLKDQI